MNKNKIAVIGGGSWATALVKIFLNNVEVVYWWMRDEKAVEYIKEYKHNKNYLPYVSLDTDKLRISTKLDEVIQESDVLVWALPAAFVIDAIESNNVKNLEDRKK